MPFEFTSLYLDDKPIVGRALDIFQPRQITKDLAIFFVHGGGWGAGTRSHYHAYMLALNELGYVCASADYRLVNGSNIHIPDQVGDLRHAYDAFCNWLTQHDRPLRVVVYGSSAGANLGSLLTTSRPGDCGEPLDVGDYQMTQPWVVPEAGIFEAALVMLEPWEDAFPPIWAAMTKAVGCAYEADPARWQRVSPIAHVSADTPPLLLMRGDNEHMVPMSHYQRYQQAMHAAGRWCEVKTYPNGEHGFSYDVTRPCQAKAYHDVLAFLKQVEQGELATTSSTSASDR